MLGNHEPSWVKDEKIWELAKKACAPFIDEPYYWPAVTEIYKNMGGAQKSSMAQTPTPADCEAKARKILVDYPNVSASTLLNTIKAQGMEITNRAEADSASTFAAVLPAKKKESKAAKIAFVTARLVERAASDNGIGPTKFRTVLIQEGLGNLRDTYYYTKQALESAITVFEGKKIYADHPSSDDERSRPERSVRDVLGYFENVALEETKEGRFQLAADVTILDEPSYAWARGLMRHAVDYSKKFPDKEFIGLSINANGQAEEVALSQFLSENEIPESALLKLHKAKDEGVDTIRIVSEITDAISCDLVTEAGAGGKVMALIEQERKEMSKKALKQEGSKETKNEEIKISSHAEAGGEKHDDAAQDEELFKQLLKKHLGEALESSGISEGMVKEAYSCAKESGLEAEAAMMQAAAYAKMAQALGAKKAKEAATTEAAPAEAKEGDKKENCPDEEKKEAAVESKESAVIDTRDEEIAKLKGENAGLVEKLRIIEHGAYVDKKLGDTGKPMKATKKIKEDCLGAKSKEQVDKLISAFMEGIKASGEAGFGLTIEVEKVGEQDNSLSLSDCIN